MERLLAQSSIGIKSHQMDAEILARGRHILEAYTGERGGHSTRDTLVGLDPGDLSFPLERWPWEAHDVTLVTLDVTQHQMDMMEAVVCQVARVASSRGLGRPNVFLMEPDIPPMRPNVTLGGHDITPTTHFRVFNC
jgi:hypothetical protein